MADIELVIKIPEEIYKASQVIDVKDEDVIIEVIQIPLEVIANGTPLPKGHGRLIDADELKTLSYEVLIDTDNPNRADGLSACNGLVEDDIDLAPTIIEADRGE